MSLNAPNAKRGPQHSTYLTGRNDVAYSNLFHADRLHYQRAKQGCEELRRAILKRWTFKPNGGLL